ncbi:MAG: WYL domain-containing protein [Verrucomicrobiia bacterium]
MVASRPPILRFKRILNALQRQVRPTRRQLAQECNVTIKTIQRDIDFLRDQLNVPIEFNMSLGGYTLRRPINPGQLIELSQSELASIFLAERAIDAHRGSSLEAPLRLAFEKLALALDGHVSIPLSELGHEISLRPFQPSTVNLKIFQTLAAGIQQKRTLEIEHTKLGEKHSKTRKVEPFHLASVGGAWYLIGHDLRSGEIRTFHLARIRKASLLAIPFDRPSSFSADKYLSGALGIFRGKGQFTIVLRFDAWAAQLIRERTIHPSQRLQNLTDGGLELRLNLSSLEEIESWVLSWGGHVKVISPKDLIRRVRASASALVANHSPT